MSQISRRMHISVFIAGLSLAASCVSPFPGRLAGSPGLVFSESQPEGAGDRSTAAEVVVHQDHILLVLKRTGDLRGPNKCYRLHVKRVAGAQIVEPILIESRNSRG